MAPKRSKAHQDPVPAAAPEAGDVERTADEAVEPTAVPVPSAPPKHLPKRALGKAPPAAKKGGKAVPQPSSSSSSSGDDDSDSDSDSSDEDAAAAAAAAPTTRRAKPVPKKAGGGGKAAEETGGAAATRSTGGAAAPPGADATASSGESGPVEVTRFAPIKVPYCPICTFPAEMCEFSGVLDKCRPWLTEQLAAEEAAALEERGRKQKGIGEDPLDPAAQKGSKKPFEVQVTLQLRSRTKRKFTTFVTGMNLYGHDIKATVQKFKKQFSCGVSVESLPGQLDAIEVQGDFIGQLQEVLVAQYKIPEDQIVVLDPIMKKSS